VRRFMRDCHMRAAKCCIHVRFNSSGRPNRAAQKSLEAFKAAPHPPRSSTDCKKRRDSVSLPICSDDGTFYMPVPGYRGSPCAGHRYAKVTNANGQTTNVRNISPNVTGPDEKVEPRMSHQMTMDIGLLSQTEPLHQRQMLSGLWFHGCKSLNAQMAGITTTADAKWIWEAADGEVFIAVWLQLAGRQCLNGDVVRISPSTLDGNG